MSNFLNSLTPRRAFAGVVMALIFFLTLEVAARVDDWVRFDASLFRRYEFDQLFRVTDKGLRGVPNARYTRWALNAEGLRGAEVRPDRGQTRIVVYGASETFGMFEDDGKEFPRILEKTLNAGSRESHFEVLNAGMPGMRVGSGVALFRELEQKFKPRAVVIYPTPTHYIGVSKPYCDRLPKPSQLAAEDSMLQLRIGDKLREETKRVLPPTLQHLLRKASIAWQSRNAGAIDRVPQASIEAFESDIKCAVAGARLAGMVPVLSTHANRFGDKNQTDDAERLTQWRQQYPEMHESGFIDLERRANESIRRIATELHLDLVDADATLSGNSKWFVDHAHFSNDGAAKMGALIAPVVLKSLEQVSR